MTTKPWGNEPASPVMDSTYLYPTNTGFTKFERACIDLKVPHPDLPPELKELILESRRLDWKARHFPKK